MAEAGETGGGISTIYIVGLLPDVYAAGTRDSLTPPVRAVLALLPNAYMQGECAGINMAGGKKPYDQAIPMNAIGLFGLHIITAGSYSGEKYMIKSEKTYKKLVTKDGLLKGYIMVGDVARAGIYTALVREKRPLHMVDFDLIKDKPQLMAFSRVEREKMLGGAVV